MHRLMAETLDRALDSIREIQSRARESGSAERPRWPMIVLVSPKGWTGPKIVDGKPVEGTWRAHQVPLDKVRENPEHLRLLEDWMRSYRPGELFDERGRLRPELFALAPKGEKRMGANPHANGGALLVDLALPDFRAFAVDVPKPGATDAEATRVQGRFLKEVLARNADARNFRIFSPDETTSNRWDAVFDVTDRLSVAELLPTDDHVGPDGRVLEMLSEHQCEGWLEGYLLTGRHGFFSCYEAFIHIVDSMFNQHAKWLKTSRQVAWRKPIASLNILLSSHVWRQDHNGFSHQDPGLPRPRREQEGRDHPHLPSAGREHASLGDRPLPAKPPLRERRSSRASSRHPSGSTWRPRPATRPRASASGNGRATTAAEPGRRHGLRGRRSDARDPRGRVPPQEGDSRSSDPRRERPRPHAPPARERAPARPFRRGVRPPLHDGPAGPLRVPRLPVAHSPAHVPAPQPRQHPRARLQGGGHDDDALRHVRPQRPRPVPARDGRHRPRPGPRARERPRCASASSRSARSTANGCAGPARTCPR